MMDAQEKAARRHIANRLREIADEVEGDQLLAFAVSDAVGMQYLPPAPGSIMQRVELNGVRTFTVVSTTEQRALGLVADEAGRLEAPLIVRTKDATTEG